VALLRKMTCNLRHAISLRHSARGILYRNPLSLSRARSRSVFLCAFCLSLSLAHTHIHVDILKQRPGPLLQFIVYIHRHMECTLCRNPLSLSPFLFLFVLSIPLFPLSLSLTWLYETARYETFSAQTLSLSLSFSSSYTHTQKRT